MHAPCVAESSCSPSRGVYITTVEPELSQQRNESQNSFMCGMFLAFFLPPFSCYALWLEVDLKPYGVLRAVSHHKHLFYYSGRGSNYDDVNCSAYCSCHCQFFLSVFYFLYMHNQKLIQWDCTKHSANKRETDVHSIYSINIIYCIEK